MSGIARTIGGFRNKIMGVDEQASYAQHAATAEQAQRQAVTAEARAARDRMNLLAQSPQQLAVLERSLSQAQSQIDRDLKQLDAIDPAIMEASKQVLNLLQGGTAAANNPLMAQRQAQRQQLLGSLRAQYGPGAESSSIGQRALQRFDMESNSLFQQNQMGTLGNLFGIATTQLDTGRGINTMLGVASQYGDYQNRLLGAEQAGSQGILSGMGGEVQGAAAPFTRDVLRTTAMRGMNEDMRNDGRQIGRAWASMGQSEKGGGGGQPASQSGLDNSRNRPARTSSPY